MSSNFKGVNSAGKMKRMMSRKSHSWWWDSHISPKNSKWLAENLEEMDRSVKEMLKLIEEEGDSFAKKAEMYYQKRPELVAHVEDFYRMYRALAERYDHVTGELRKNVDLNSQGSGSGSDFGSEPPSPSLPSKPAIPKPGRRAAGFDFFLRSGGSSDRSRKGSDDDSSSSPSSESDSDTDDNTKDFNGNGNGLDERISELENELSIVTEKLCEHANCEQKHAYLSSKISALENDILAANEKLGVSEAEIVRLQQHLHEKNLTSEAMSAELSYENLVISKLEGQVDELENEIKMNKLEIEEFKGVISANDLAIEQYKTQLAEASNKSAQEKSHLEADIMNFEGFIEEFKANVERISGEKLQLETNLLAANEKLCVSEAEIVSLEQKLQEGDSTSEAMSAELSYENQVISKLEGHVGELESEIKELKGVISANDQVIEQYKTQLAEAFSKSAQEKSHFEADIVKLEGVIKELKAEIERLSDEKLQLGTNLAVANEKLAVSETEIMSLQEKLQEGILTTQAVGAELSYENRVISKLEKQVNELESELKRSKRDIEDLKGLISANDQAIEQYKAQLIEASSKFIEEKSHLEADIIHLEEVVKELKTEIERNSQLKLQLETNLLERQHTIEELKAAAEISAYSFSQEKSSLNAQISSLSKSTTSLEAKLIQLEAEKAEACKERDGQIADINQSFEALKQRITLLLVEKEELSGRVTALIKDIKIRDDRVVRMDEHLHQLHLEHVKLMKEIEESRRAGRELREKVKELEEEVEKQRIAISDGAEGKREAIRQLCFSLEHYRDGYNHLRQMLMQGHSKRPTTVMAV